MSLFKSSYLLKQVISTALKRCFKSPIVGNTCRFFGKRGKKKPLPFNLVLKLNSSLKSKNRAVFAIEGIKMF